MEFCALAHLALVLLRELIWREKKNFATSAAIKCHCIATIVRTLLCNQLGFTDAYLQCFLHSFPMNQINWLTHHGIQELAHEPKQLRHWPKILEEDKVVHIRGTPSSGKTTLAYLLYHYYKERGEPVVLIDGWHNIPNPTAHLVNLCVDSRYGGVNSDNLLEKDLVFLFDEAQQSYSDLKLWLGIIKTQSCSTSGPRICLFSSYGSPATGPTQYPHGSTPIHFGASQRVSISVSSNPYAPNIGLFYNKEESNDVIRLRCADPTQKLAIDPAASDYLY